jgi:hypothetical protein
MRSLPGLSDLRLAGSKDTLTDTPARRERRVSLMEWRWSVGREIFTGNPLFGRGLAAWRRDHKGQDQDLLAVGPSGTV